MNRKKAAILLTGALLFAGCSPPSEPSSQTDQTTGTATTARSGPPVSINAQMVSVVDHAGHALWAVEQSGQAPKTDADWEMVAEHAIQMAAAGTLITLPGSGSNDLRLVQEPDWGKWARAMSDAGMAAYQASEKKDFEALVAANSRLVESCEGCHKQYKPELPSEGITHQHMHAGEQ